MNTCLASPKEVDRLPKRIPGQDYTSFGQKVEELLADRGWTQDQLSDATDPNVSQGQISNYKYGRRNPSRETARVLARAFVKDFDQQEQDRRYPVVVNALLLAAGFAPDFSDAHENAETRVPRRVVEFYEHNPPDVTDPITDIIDNVFDLMDRGIIPSRSGRHAG